MAVMFIKLFTLCLPFFCLLLTRVSSTPPPPPRSLITTLHSSGYSRFASKLTTAISTNAFNATGTIFAPPDLAFSFAAAKFSKHHHKFPPSPSTSLLLYHTINQPLTLRDLHSRDHSEHLHTLFEGHCIFTSKNSNGNLSINGVKIRHPNLHVDDHLTVHGVDAVLDLSKCPGSNPTAEIKTQIDRDLLDLAAVAMRSRGYYVAATAMTIRSEDLISLDGVTIFAPPDKKLFSFPNGFTYDFRQHVLPKRLRFADLLKLPAKLVLETINPNKTLVIDYVDGYVTLNGAIIDSTEIYLNRWIVVISVSRTLVDDVGDGDYSPISDGGGNVVSPASPIYSNSVVSPSSSGYYDETSRKIDGVGSTAPIRSDEVRYSAPIYSAMGKDYKIAVPSMAPTFPTFPTYTYYSGDRSDRVPSPALIYSATGQTNQER